MARHRFVILVTGIVLAALAVPAPASAAAPPFVPPSEWASICDAQRPAGRPLVRGTNCRWLGVDGYPRRYLVYVPESTAFAIDREWPLVFMFHGTGGDGERFWNISGWKELAEREGVVVVFPTSLRYRLIEGATKTKWNYFGLEDHVEPARLDGYPADAPFPARDTRFVTLMLKDISRRLTIDPDRRYLAGFSNGAQFAFRLSVERSRVFAAGAWSGAGADVVMNPRRNMPVLFGFGTRDDRFVDAGNEAHDPDVTKIPLAFDDALPYIDWYLRVHLQTFDLRPAIYDLVEAPTYTRVTWSTPKPRNRHGNVAQFLLMDDLAHKYPRPSNNPHGFSMAAISWEFFEQHPR